MFEVSPIDIQQETRGRQSVAKARDVYFYLLEATGKSHNEIAKMGRRERSSVTCAIKRTKEAISLQEFRGNGERILVVEDEKVVRDFCVTALSDSGYLVFEAATAQEALDTFERQNGNFNLVFADIVLPDKTGLDLVDHLISIKPELRVLLCSGFADKKSRWEDIRERGHRFLHKPYELVQLLRTVKEVLTQ